MTLPVLLNRDTSIRIAQDTPPMKFERSTPNRKGRKRQGLAITAQEHSNVLNYVYIRREMRAIPSMATWERRTAVAIPNRAE
jgi:hypothetical protein